MANKKKWGMGIAYKVQKSLSLSGEPLKIIDLY